MNLKKYKKSELRHRLREYRGKNIKKFIGRKKINDNDNLDKNGRPLRFRRRDLRGCDFSGMILENIDFYGADLRGVSFRFSTLKGVLFNNVDIGISNRARVFFEFICALLALLAGLTITYSLDYFFLLVDQNLFLHVNPGRLFLVFIFFGIFIFLVAWAIFRGMGNFFSGFFIFVVSMGFLIQAFSKPEVAAVSVHGLSCFVGSLSGIFIHSQAIYLSKELNKESTFLSDSIRSYAIDALAIAGSIAGAYIGAHSSQYDLVYIILVFHTIAALLCGHNLGAAADIEKITYIQVKDEFFEFSEQEKNITFGDIKEQRKEKLTAKRYSIVRVFFDSCLNRIRTNFFQTDISNISFLNSRIDKSYFLPNEIDRDSDNDVLLSIKGLRREKLLRAINRSSIHTLIINIGSSFGGGLATGNALQFGGENLVGKNDAFVRGVAEALDPFLPFLDKSSEFDMRELSSKIIEYSNKYSSEEQSE